MGVARQRHQLLIHFGYDGSRFHGLQPQRDVPTAGGALRARLEEAAGQRANALVFAARTDAGVNAIENLATCHFPLDVDLDSVRAAVAVDRDDGLLCVHADPVPYTVHARGAGRGKRYRYLIDDGCPERSLDAASATVGSYRNGGVWPVTPRLDVERMREAAPHFIGTHDFSTFRARRCEIKSPVKTLSVVRVGGPFLHDPAAGPDGRRRFVVEIAGTAFVRRMIRLMVGCLAEVGAGLRPPDDVARLLALCDRTQVGVCAPARGLTLMRVGCGYPADGSGLLPELAHLSEAPEASAGIELGKSSS